VFEANPHTILAANMLGVRGKVQDANGVIHLVVEHARDLFSARTRFRFGGV
jgi:hypothetical protein